MEGRYKTSLSLEGQVSVGCRDWGQVNLTIPTRSPVQIPVQRRSFHVSLASSADIAAFKSDAVARYPVRSSSLAMRSLSVMAAISPPLGLSMGEACCLVNGIRLVPAGTNDLQHSLPLRRWATARPRLRHSCLPTLSPCLPDLHNGRYKHRGPVSHSG